MVAYGQYGTTKTAPTYMRHALNRRIRRRLDSADSQRSLAGATECERNHSG